jgi:hypothetical protein
MKEYTRYNIRKLKKEDSLDKQEDKKVNHLLKSNIKISKKIVRKEKKEKKRKP